MTRRERIREFLEELDDSDLLEITSAANSWNSGLEEYNWQHLDMQDIWDNYCNGSDDFEEIVEAAAEGRFDPSHDYYRWWTYGIESTDDPEFDLGEVAEYLDEEFDDLGHILWGGWILDMLRACDTLAEEKLLESIDLESERMTVEQVETTLRECAYEDLLKASDLTNEQLHLLAKVIAEKHCCIDPADVIAAADAEYPGVA